MRRCIDAHTNGDLATIRELLAPGFVDHRQVLGQEGPGREGYIEFVAQRKAALSVLRYNVEDQMAAEGDRGVSHLTRRFAQDRRELAGFAPTAKEFEVKAIIVHRIVPYEQRVGEAEEPRARGMPIGLMPEMGYEEKEIVLGESEAALFYTDGLVEAHAPDGEMFGFPRLRALISEHAE